MKTMVVMKVVVMEVMIDVDVNDNECDGGWGSA